MTEDTYAPPFVGEDAQELKERLELQSNMETAIHNVDFSNEEQWAIQAIQDGQNAKCWIMCERSMLPAAAEMLVITLTNVIRMADEHGPEYGIAARMACMRAFKKIETDIQQPIGEC